MSDAAHLAYLRAQRATVSRLLAGAGEAEDDLERIGLERRIEDLDREITVLEDRGIADELERQIPRSAEAVLIFGGGPVMDAHAIEAAFAADALRTFQKLVSTTAATQGGRRLGARGRIPDERGSRLFITGTVEGSFGFELGEAREAPHATAGLLQQTVDDVGRMLDAAHAGDEAFDEVVYESNPRVLGALAEFLNVLDAAGATLHLSTGTRECTLGTPDATRATAERARRVRMTEEAKDLAGELVGVLPHARRFEFRMGESGEIIDGRLTDEIEDPNALSAFLMRPCAASFWIVTLVHAGKERRAYYLTQVVPLSVDGGP
jgi:hypothetical protein